jgi:hypothetical protein
MIYSPREMEREIVWPTRLYTRCPAVEQHSRTGWRWLRGSCTWRSSWREPYVELPLETSVQGVEAMPVTSTMSPFRAVLLTTITATIAATIGISLLASASKIMDFYRKHYASNRFLRPLVHLWFWEPENPIHELMLKIGGVFMICIAIFLVFVMVRGLLQ